MPITYELDHERRRIVATATGPVDSADATALVSAIVQQQCSHYAMLLDGREAEIVASAEQVRGFVSLVARVRSEHGQARSAFVTTADVTFGMARMYATLAAESDSGFMVYRAIEDATAWLGWVESPSYRQPG